MPALFKIIQKNFKLLLRSKSSSLIVILGPLLLIFLVGIAFDNMGKYKLNVGVYSDAYSELSESFIIRLQAKEFRVIKIDTSELCIQKIKQGTLHTCIVFPPNLNIADGQNSEISFYVDHTKINLVSSILDALQSGVEEQANEISTDLTTNLINKLDYASKEIEQQSASLSQLKSSNSQIGETISGFKTNTHDFGIALEDMQDYFVETMDNAKIAVAVAMAKVNTSNASSSQKTSINEKIAGINTYLYMIRSKMDDPYNRSEADWERLIRLTNEVNSNVATLNLYASQSFAKIEALDTALQNIKLNLNSIQIKQASTIANPVSTVIKPIVPEKTYLGYVFPSLIILVIMFIGILLANTLVIMEKHSPAYFRNFITPTSNLTFIFATYLTSLIITFMQIGIILLISIFFFNADLSQSWNVLIPGLFLITSFFILVGMIIGYIFNSEETSTLAAISTGSVFLFLSSVILPLESMPEYIRKFAEYNPFVLAESLVRKTIFFQADFFVLSNEFKWLGIYSLCLILIIFLFELAVRKNLWHKIINLRYRESKKNSKK